MGNNQSVPAPTPTLESYASFLLPNEASFVNALRQRKIYDIFSKVDKSADSIGAPPELIGQPSVVSSQGNEPICASHAVGKAIVDIIDGYTYNGL